MKGQNRLLFYPENPNQPLQESNEIQLSEDVDMYLNMLNSGNREHRFEQTASYTFSTTNSLEEAMVVYRATYKEV